jgi:stage II sporulation protein D
VFQGGTIWWSAAGGAHLVTGPLRDAWARSGYENGALGYPTSDQIALRDGGVGQVFSGGVLYWSRAGGAHVVRGPVWEAWGRSGWENGPLGYPVSGEVPLAGGYGQVFQGGTIYWSPGGGAHSVSGVFRDAWAAQGWENGRLGYPIADELRSPAGSRMQLFAGGSIGVSPSGRVQVTYNV